MNSFTEKSRASESSEFQQNLEILRQIDFFAGLHLETLKVLAYLCTRESFKPGDYLFHQDDNDGKAFYVLSGKAELLREAEEGGVRLKTYADGEFFGSMVLVGDVRRLFSMKAMTPMTCLVLTRDKFGKAMEQFPDLMPKILQSLVKSVNILESRYFSDRDGLCDGCKKKLGVSLI